MKVFGARTLDIGRTPLRSGPAFGDADARYDLSYPCDLEERYREDRPLSCSNEPNHGADPVGHRTSDLSPGIRKVLTNIKTLRPEHGQKQATRSGLPKT